MSRGPARVSFLGPGRITLGPNLVGWMGIRSSLFKNHPDSKAVQGRSRYDSEMASFLCLGLSYPSCFTAAWTLLLHDASMRLKGYNRATMIGHLEI